MENYYFYKSIRKTIIQFLDIFNNINIERYDVAGNVKGSYRVPIRYGPKSKSYLWIKDHSRNEEMLPMISIYLTGIDFDVNRLTNKYQDILVSDSVTTGIYAKNAVPYNIGFTVNLWALHMVDIDQIYEQILPYFTPHAFIRVNIPELNIIYDVKVVCTGCSPVMTDDVGEEEARVIKWDTNFTVQTYLFKPQAVTKQLIGSFGTSGTSGKIADPWVTSHVYHVGDAIYSNGLYYSCIVEHTSSADKIPSTGANWSTYWVVVSGTSGYGWTSGMGTSGYSATAGVKTVTRYYTDLDTFEERDTPIREIFEDERPSETISYKPVGIDSDAKIILDYEKFPLE